MDSRSGVLVASVVAQRSIASATRDEMWNLFRRYYEDVTREQFERDLAKKQDVIIVHDTGDKTVQGFTTLYVFDKSVDGRRVVAIFSGDTVIDARYWGQTALQRAWVRYVARQKLKHPTTPVYWFLVSKGYRTYLLLSRNFPEYWPRHDQPTPAWQSRLMDALARELFPESWRPELGLLQFERCAGRIRGGVAPIEARMLVHEDIAFFARMNPRASETGDELCCLGHVNARMLVEWPFRLTRRRLRRALGRVWGRARAAWGGSKEVHAESLSVPPTPEVASTNSKSSDHSQNV